MADTLRDLVELAIVVDPTYDQNCYILRRRDTDQVLVFDPGLQHPRTLAVLEETGLHCDRVLLTHGHPDHVSGVPAIKAAHGCEAAIHPADRFLLEHVTMLPGVPGTSIFSPQVVQVALLPALSRGAFRRRPHFGHGNRTILSVMTAPTRQVLITSRQRTGRAVIVAAGQPLSTG